MAEFLWTFAVEELLKKTMKLAAEQMDLASDFKKDLSKLKDSLLMVEAIVSDADRIKADHQALNLWVEKLEEIVSEADFLLEELAYEDLRHIIETRMVRNFVFRLRMANKIKSIAKKLDEHCSRASLVGFVATVTSKEIEYDVSQIHETDSFLDEFGVIGRETEVSEIVNKLMEISGHEEALVVLPIVGTGGLGKTALAKVIFNHELIRENFDRAIWVCVSEPFVIKEILKAILETLNANFGGLDTKEAILKELKKKLSDKRYFLVLDDVWSEDPILWNELRACLFKINKGFGSVVVVTTRSDEVAKITETHWRHHLRKLSNDHCWSLFGKCAFGSDFPIIPQVDVVVREELVKKFGGIPLVVKVLGGMVKLDKNYEGLQSTLENLMRIPLEDESHISSTIKLSVDRLPSSSLKQCFAYCSKFPRGFLFVKEELVKMWIAQGFVQLLPNGSNVMMEDIGAKYFNILLSRSLFHDAVKDNRGRIIYCKMHDLIYDVACAISNAQKLKLDMLVDGKFEGDKVLSVCRGIRTLYCGDNVAGKLHMSISDSHVFENKITDFTNLRVLIIHSWFTRKLPDSIAELKHLRYLDVSNSLIRKLPKSIVLLYNLQTLKLGSGTIDLPSKLRKLVNLRHLEFFAHLSNQTKQMPQHVSRLIQLQTLSGFVVGFDEGCKIEELGALKNLKGELILTCLERVRSKREAIAAKLVEKENVSNLYFQWSSRCGREDLNYKDLNVLEGLQPHKNLQTLSIQNFAGELLPNCTFVENLVEIYLYDCERCETLPMLGQLSKLEVLRIRCLHSVRRIGNEFYGNYCNERTLFPKLKTFYISEMNRLKYWEEIATISNATVFPHLESLSIVCCTELMNIPNFFASCRERLEVDSVVNNARLFPSFEGSPKLRHLTIYECEKLAKLPIWLELCSSLEVMNISHCPNLINFPLNFQNLQNLFSLTITNIQKLPEGLACIRNLKILKVRGELQGFDWSPFSRLSSLEDLELVDMGSCLSQLPQQLEHLAALRSLVLVRFNGIESLPEWLGNVTSLEGLDLHSCRNLKNLASKEAMSNLTRLNRLRVYGCPQLEFGEDGCERAKVSHVPDIYYQE